MYTSFRIQNFKGFKDLEFDDLARVNLLAGKNNTGKTSVLEALAVHIGQYAPFILLRLDENLLRDDYGNPVDDTPPSWHTIMHNFDMQSPVIFLGRYKSVSFKHEWQTIIKLANPDDAKQLVAEEYQLRTSRRYRYVEPENVYSSRYTSVVEIIVDKLPNDEKPLIYHLTSNGSDILPSRRWIASIPIIFMRSSLQTSYFTDARRFSELDASGNTETLIAALQVIEPRLDSVKLLYQGEYLLIHADIGLEEPVPVMTMGEGVKRVVSLILAIGNARNGIVLIDEIENGLHYSILPDVWRAIDEASKLFNVQVFATTHSREVIAAAHDVFSEGVDIEGGEPYDFRYHRLDRRVDTGEIVRTTYSPASLDASLEMDYEVR